MKYTPISIDEINHAKERISDDIIRTPLVRFNIDDETTEIYLKLENLQPTRAFKIRAASNAVRKYNKTQLDKGIWTISSGNWAQALAWMAGKIGTKCTIIVPEDIPAKKEEAIKQLRGEIIKVPLEIGLPILATREFEGMDGVFIHPFSDLDVMAGNATIALEILDDLPDFDTLLIPWGGGGLACGIASAIRALRPDVKIYATEIETCTPLATAFQQKGVPDNIPYSQSFVDAIGYPFLLTEMYEMAEELLDGSIVVGLEETADAIRLLSQRNCVVVEGGGALPVAAALSGKAGKGKIVCIISGGNIDSGKLIKILKNEKL